MEKKLIERKEKLAKNFPQLMECFNVIAIKTGVDLENYKKIMVRIRKNLLKDLIKERDFIYLLRETLISWGMNSRGAKIKDFNEFKEEVSKNQKTFVELSRYKLKNITRKELPKIKEKLNRLYDNLYLMKSKLKLISNSKLLHFLLPDLIMPIDSQHVLTFLSINNESTENFLKIFEWTYCVAKKLDAKYKLKNYRDKDWNQSIPKIIDNAIWAWKPKENSKARSKI